MRTLTSADVKTLEDNLVTVAQVFAWDLLVPGGETDNLDVTIGGIKDLMAHLAARLPTPVVVGEPAVGLAHGVVGDLPSGEVTPTSTAT